MACASREHQYVQNHYPNSTNVGFVLALITCRFFTTAAMIIVTVITINNQPSEIQPHSSTENIPKLNVYMP